MNFQDAFNAAFDAEEKRIKAENPSAKFAVKPDTAKTLAFLWNMIAAAGGQLDDMAYIDKNNSIVSIPIDTEGTPEEKKTKKSKKAQNEPDINPVGGDNGGEEEKEESGSESADSAE